MTNPDPKPKVWEATDLKSVVEKMIAEDKRFEGLSRYIVNIRFYWSTVINTACAGRGFIFFNPDFYESLPEETRKTVVVHEVWHLILKHLDRSEGFDPVTYNIAADHVINNAITSDGFTWDGFSPVMDPTYKGRSTEQIYNTIWEKREEEPPMPSPNHVSKETILDQIKDVLAQDAQPVSMDEQQATDDANIKSSMPGMSPGQKVRVLQETKTKVLIKGATYQEIFKEYLTDPLSGGNRTFMRPNRRSHGMRGNGLILPGRYPKRGHLNRLTHLVYALDVSGSITSHQAQQFNDSVRTIKEILNPEKLTVLFFDTRIVLEKTFTDKDKYGTLHVKAGGGTNLTDVYRRMETLKAEALVIFTDLEVRIPPEPEWDSIWLVPYDRAIPPGLYGEVYLIPKI
jgi:predicted metal-dependent peptidase